MRENGISIKKRLCKIVGVGGNMGGIRGLFCCCFICCLLILRMLGGYCGLCLNGFWNW